MLAKTVRQQETAQVCPVHPSLILSITARLCTYRERIVKYVK